ncbi:hypothetical protein FSP39_019103 [Pinctada imbricata]|uniref:Uncharacterized protein n=1 Tax=Pinctada imbricata TaxID=66713 RepID=A0AA88YP79_PINIB|nr:hypothetical protein FSP39_019103 [Pinctada imbricata]
MSAGAHLLVAAIDFGTTFSGYAYSFRTDHDKDPLKIYANVEWNTGNTEEGTRTCATLKTPTTVLFKKDGSFHSFGYEAESKYADLLEEDEADGWFYFKHFKMLLYRAMGLEENLGRRRRPRKITRDMMLKDESGKTMKALSVFSEAIRYLRNHLLTQLKESTDLDLVDDKYILWVLTVPAIWGQEAKQFMREAAEMAGIMENKLQLALEPEAAAIYCKELAMQKKDGNEQSMESFHPGRCFMILDCGGGTVDITVHRVQNRGSLEELFPPSGGPWGGTNVDMRFYDFLSDVFGRGTWKSFKDTSPLSFLELQRAFDVKKRLQGQEEKITLTNGISEIMDEFKDQMKRDFTIPGNLTRSVKISKKRLRIDVEVMKGFFNNAVDSISDHLIDLFKKPEIERVDTILMVGGFSESSQVKERIKAKFPSKRFIIPREASLAVLKGAVIFGHSPRSITTRCSPATFGVATDVPFDEKKHPINHMHMKDGSRVCTDVFKIMIAKDQPQMIGDTYYEEFFRPSRADDTIAEIEVYASTKRYPRYTTDEGCKKVGVVKIQIPNTRKGKDRLIKITMHFGHTELFVTALENGTNNIVSAKFDCLQ